MSTSKYIILKSKFWQNEPKGLFAGIDLGFRARSVFLTPGDIETLVEAILRFAAESALVAAMGRKARDMLAAGFSRRQALQKWHNALQSIGQTR